MNIFFPAICLGCRLNIRTGVFCDTCRRSVVLNRTFFCGMCSARLPEAKKICHKDAYIMGAASSYSEERIRNLIHSLKFDSIGQAAKPLADILSEYLEQIPIDWEQYVVIPIPLSKRRERARGFNQATLIGKRIADNLKIQFSEDILIRIGHKRPQSEMKSVHDRRKNVVGSFSIQNYPALKNIRKVLLIDDVTTSGATFREAVTILRRAGIKTIIAAAAAKA